MSDRHCESSCVVGAGINNPGSRRTVSAAQIRAGRALLVWEMRTLAAAARVHRETICNIEAGRAVAQSGTMAPLVAALESAGVVFAENDAVGVKTDILKFSAANPRGNRA